MAKLTSKALIAMAGTAAMKARDYANKNPHKVEETLAKVQTSVSRRTQGKYDAHLHKGSTAVRKGLGLPNGPAGPIGPTAPVGPPGPTGSR
jgi:MT0933-like antitoxin protein